jgi:predicted RNase H-like nuclease (RuvC/YqgF family)
MKSSLGWFIAGAVVVFSAALVCWYALRGKRTEYIRASVDMLEAWHHQAVREKRQQIAKLTDDFESNQREIETLQLDLAEKRRQLNYKYERAGLSVDEIAERFSRIAL